MSIAPSHGYPDWGRFAAQQDVVHIDEFGIALAAGAFTTRGMFPTFGALGLNIYFLSLSNAATLTINWYADFGQTLVVNTDQLIIRANGWFNGTIPTRGAFVQFVIEAPFAVGTSVLLRSANARGLGPGEELAQDPIMIQRTATAVGAGATVADNALQTRPGWAHWHVSSTLATWTARLMVTNLDGVSSNIALWNNGMPQPAVQVFLPPAPIRHEFTNTTAGAGTFNAYLVGRPLGGDF